MCVKSISSVFRGLVIQKSARSANLRQQEIEMACLIIKYCGLSAESLTLLLFCDECERIGVNSRLKTEPFLLWRWVIKIGRLRSDAQPMICTQFLPEFPWSLIVFPDKILRRIREKKLQLRDLRIFLKQTITWTRDFLMLFILSVSNSSVKIIYISEDNDFSP